MSQLHVELGLDKKKKDWRPRVPCLAQSQPHCGPWNRHIPTRLPSYVYNLIGYRLNETNMSLMSHSTPTGAETSAQASTRFDQLSDECVGLVALYLRYHDLTALLLSGSTGLRAKIDRGVQEICAQIPSLGRYPLQAFKYPHLRRLTIASVGSTNPLPLFQPMLAKDDVLVPIEGHENLDFLEIHSTLAFTVLYDRPSHGKLADLLPRLRTLRMSGNGSFNPRILANAPPQLTELSIRLRDSYARRAPVTGLDSASISSLPRNLETLSLVGVSLALKADETLETLSFPPNLTSLKIWCLAVAQLVPLLPTSMRTISLAMRASPLGHHGNSTHTLRTSDLHRFKALNKLVIRCPIFLEQLCLVLDQPFPATLTTLKLPDFVSDFQYQYVSPNPSSNEPHPQGVNTNSHLQTLKSALPSSLTSLHGLDQQHPEIDWLQGFPLLKYARIEEGVWSQLPRFTTLPPLVELSFGNHDIDDTLVKALPVTLTRLQASLKNTPVWLETIAKLTRLTILHLTSKTQQLPSKGFWNVVKDRLTNLEVRPDYLESFGDLGGDWKKLQSLHFSANNESLKRPSLKYELDNIYAASSSDYEAGKPYLRFPANITRLQLVLGSQYAHFCHPISYLAKLQHFLLIFNPWSGMEEVPEAESPLQMFKSLPDSLTYLRYSSRFRVSPDILRKLPKKLRILAMFVDLKDGVWNKEHLASLPPSLSTCQLNAADSPDLNFGDVSELMPRTLLEFSMGAFQVLEGRSEAMIEIERQQGILYKPHN